VKETGYNSFEFWAWWDKDLDILVEAIAKLKLVCGDFFVPDYLTGG